MMNKPKPSLLERAAEIYDFASGLPMPEAAPLPAPRARPEPAPAAKAEPVRLEAPFLEPSRRPQERPEPAPVRRQAPRTASSTPAAHARVELDPDVLAQSNLLVPDAPGGNLAEEMRLIKRRLLGHVDLQASRGDDRARLILVASGQPGEGKTFFSLNLALSIATERDRGVLLIDGDNAKPDIFARLGVTEEGPGFVGALTDPALDPESLVLDTDITGLSLLGPGRRERSVPELLASDRARDVLDRLLAADPKRIILIDSSPALAASATIALAEHVGQALVVVGADTTSEADLKETLDLLSPCEQLSLVLNRTAFQVGRRRYGKYEEYR